MTKGTRAKRSAAVGKLFVKEYQPSMLGYIVPTGDSTGSNGAVGNIGAVVNNQVEDVVDDEKRDDETSPTYKRAIDGLLSWLESDNKANYHIVFSKEKTKVGVTPEKVHTACGRAAIYITDYVNSPRSSSEPMIKYSGTATRGRGYQHRKKFFLVAHEANRTGAGVKEKGSADSFQQQLEQDCQHYGRMESVFGKTPHLQPAFRVTTGRLKGQSTINFFSRTKNFQVQPASVGKGIDNRIPKGVIDVESWTRGEVYNHFPGDEVFEEDQNYDQEPQGADGDFDGEALMNYRSQAGSTVASTADSKKRPHDLAKGESGNTADSKPRQLSPQNMYNHPPPGKHKSISHDMINELMAVKLHKSRGNANTLDPSTVAQLQIQREMALS